LDETTDNSCFGKMLSIQAKTGLPLAYVTTGQRVPDDISFPDAHAIAARILTTVPL
jgi:flagellar biosynthesis GTPase FlhF